MIIFNFVYFTVAQHLERWTCDKQVVGSNPAWGQKLRNHLGQVVYTYVPFTKQYNMVSAKGL